MYCYFCLRNDDSWHQCTKRRRAKRGQRLAYLSAPPMPILSLHNMTRHCVYAKLIQQWCVFLVLHMVLHLVQVIWFKRSVTSLLGLKNINVSNIQKKKQSGEFYLYALPCREGLCCLSSTASPSSDYLYRLILLSEG